jgi:murein DD-endopeptidase MepM/ murein hydrolase activator NlpD
MKNVHQDTARQTRLRTLREVALTRFVASKLPEGRWSRRQWAQASVLASIALLAAALVPGMEQAVGPAGSQLKSSALSLSIPLALPSADEEANRPDAGQWQRVNLRKGETLSALLSSLGFTKNDVQAFTRHPETRKELSKLSSGTEISVMANDANALQAVRFPRSEGEVELVRKGEGFVVKTLEAKEETRTVVLSGTVGRDLMSSARKAGLTRQNIAEMTDDIFKYDIDFDSDLNAKDRFSVVVDQTWKNGQLVETSPVLAASFTVGHELHTGFRHVRGGKAEYFSAEGRALKRPFIRMPIPYARLSSGFGGRRHPILGITRMHKGVDYAASTGTPIMAAGDARVKFVGRGRGYGNVVELDHGSGQTTFYAHMSRFAKIRVGQRISQGTVIGYVGSTGLSTGPHLHYEFRVNGVYRNPLKVTMAPPAPLSGSDLVAFRSETRRAMDKIRTVEKIIYPGSAKVVVASTTAAKQPSKG